MLLTSFAPFKRRNIFVKVVLAACKVKLTYFNNILEIKIIVIFQQNNPIGYNQFSDLFFFTKLDTDYRGVKDRDLVKLDEVEKILYTNDTN